MFYNAKKMIRLLVDHLKFGYTLGFEVRRNWFFHTRSRHLRERPLPLTWDSYYKAWIIKERCLNLSVFNWLTNHCYTCLNVVFPVIFSFLSATVSSYSLSPRVVFHAVTSHCCPQVSLIFPLFVGLLPSHLPFQWQS